MTIDEILDLTRTTILDDTIGPDYLWSNTEIIHYLNIAIEELYRETLFIEDRSTAALTQLKLLSNLGTYTLDARTLNIKPGAKLSTNTDINYGILKRTSEPYMDQLSHSWREITDTYPTRFIPDCGRSSLSIYPKFNDNGEVVGVSNISFSGSTITKAGEDFSAHYIVGDEINIDGTTLNDGYKTLATVGTTTMTTTAALVTEASTSATLRKVCDTLLMVVNRLPLAEFTISNIGASPAVSPEIKTMYHRELLYGIGREAYLKKDTQTYNLEESARNGLRFEALKVKIRRDLSFLNRSERQGSSAYSGIWKGY